MKQDQYENDVKEKEIEIIINPFIIMYKVRKDLLSKKFIFTWFLFVSIMFLMYFLPSIFSVKKIDLFSISDFLAPAITGLSFTLALIVATTKLFTSDHLVKIYEHVDEDNKEEGYLFYRTLAPYIWTSTIWLIVSIGALFAKLFVFDLYTIANDIIKIIYSSFVLMGLMSLWSLLVMHIADIAVDAEIELNKKDEESL